VKKSKKERGRVGRIVTVRCRLMGKRRAKKGEELLEEE
jgi:hypothetical protein